MLCHSALSHLVNSFLPASDTPVSLAMTGGCVAVIVYLVTLPCYFLVADYNFAK